jgi:PBSX family phage terminase large subunit
VEDQTTEKEIWVNDVYLPYYDNQSRFLILYGGAGSGKSVFAADKWANRILCEQGHNILALRKVGDTVHESIYAELMAAFDARDVLHEFKINITEHSFYHKPTGNRIRCRGLDDVSKIKSIKGITGIWMEEATEFEENDLDQLNLRIRGKKKNYVQYILSFNPIDENHWLKKRFFDKKDPDATVVHTTYKDNQYLTEEDIRQMLKLAERNPLYYDVYALGKWGIVLKTNKFLYSFSKEKHVIESYTPNPHLPIMVSFDFNVEPMTSLVSQQIDENNVIAFDELEVPEGSTEEMVELVIAKYPTWLGNIEITGDATGRNREKARRGNINSYTVIKDGLELYDREIKVPTKNPELKDSRVLCNSILQHADFKITKNCEKTIEDAIYGAMKNTPSGAINLVKTDEQGLHFLDNLRYTLHVHYPDFIKNPKKYRTKE